MMVSALHAAALTAALLGGLPDAPVGYLWFYRTDDRGQTSKAVVPYVPREGDMIFYDDQSKFWEFMYALAHTTPPYHCGIVVRKPTGELATLEAGPDDTLFVEICDILPRLHHFKGIIQVRRCKRGLTPEQSARLTAWAQAQAGKHYAWLRLALQITPLKTRGGPLRRSLARTYFDRHRWICSELNVAAAELVGLLDPAVLRATNVYPAELVDERVYDLRAVYEESGYWAPHP
jgi:hypothetical protein